MMQINNIKLSAEREREREKTTRIQTRKARKLRLNFRLFADWHQPY